MTAETELDEASADGACCGDVEILASPGGRAVIAGIYSVEGPPERDAVCRASKMEPEEFTAAVAEMEEAHLLQTCSVIHRDGDKTGYLYLTLRGIEVVQRIRSDGQ